MSWTVRWCVRSGSFAMRRSVVREVSAMKKSSISFAQLRRLLLDLQFTESQGNAFRRFEHPESGTVFRFRPYALNEHITVQERLPRLPTRKLAVLAALRRQ